MSKRNNNNRNNSNNNRRNNTNSTNNTLSSINNQPIQTRCIRYSGNPSSATVFDVKDLTSVLLAVTNTSTAAIPLFETVRLRRVKVTCLSDDGSNSGFLSFMWNGEREPNSKSTILYSPGYPTSQNFYPPEGSLAGFWVSQETTETDTSLFTIDTSDNTVMIVLDFEISYVIVNGASEAFTLSAAATFSGIAALAIPVGSEIFLPMDLSAVASA